MLDVAERLAQTRGFNGFSYADIAAEVGVTKASLHYHFSSKAALGRALITRYTERFAAALEAIAATAEPAPAKLGQYVELYEGVLVRDRMCLCGMFAAEFATLPAPMQAEVRRFFDGNEDWLAAILDEGRARHGVCRRAA
jgi:TetR/AcrR family transcriptional repressor of nem operon